MKRENLAIALTFLLAPQTLPGQAPSGSERPVVSPQQTTSTQPSPAPRVRTPREDEELRADLMMVRKQYAEAVPIYEKLIAQEPRNAALLNKLGIAYQQQAMLDQAKRYYERAAKVDKTYANAHNNIGTVHYQRRKYGKAIRAYKKALEIRPDMAPVHSNLGYAYFAQRHYDEALAAFGRALELDPTVFERAHSGGSLLQDRSVDDPGLFNFLLAKSFAAMGNAERCAHYLRKARDEGYKGLAAARTDPAFAKVINDPGVQEILQLTPPPGDKPPAPSSPGS